MKISTKAADIAEKATKYAEKLCDTFNDKVYAAGLDFEPVSYSQVFDAKWQIDSAIYLKNEDDFWCGIESMVEALSDFIDYALYRDCFISEAQADHLCLFKEYLEKALNAA